MRLSSSLCTISNETRVNFFGITQKSWDSTFKPSLLGLTVSKPRSHLVLIRRYFNCGIKSELDDGRLLSHTAQVSVPSVENWVPIADPSQSLLLKHKLQSCLVNLYSAQAKLLNVWSPGDFSLKIVEPGIPKWIAYSATKMLRLPASADFAHITNSCDLLHSGVLSLCITVFPSISSHRIDLKMILIALGQHCIGNHTHTTHPIFGTTSSIKPNLFNKFSFAATSFISLSQVRLALSGLANRNLYV